jgi:RNA polymerase sigma-70 factor, ECF subfamily
MLDQATAPAPAFDTLVAAYLPQLRSRAARLCHRQGDADDVVQDALLRAFRGRAQLREPERARGWLLAILGTTFLDRCRRRRVRPREVELAFEPPATTPDDAPAWTEVSLDDVRAAVDRLPDDVRDTFRMFALEGRDYVHIAAALGIPKATVGTRLHRARRHLRALLAAS